MRQKCRLRVDVPHVRFRQCGFPIGRGARVPRRIPEPVVHAEFGEMDAGIDVDGRQTKVAEVVHAPRQVDILIFDLGAPVAADGEFDAGARGPAGLIVADP